MHTSQSKDRKICAVLELLYLYSCIILMILYYWLIGIIFYKKHPQNVLGEKVFENKALKFGTKKFCLIKVHKIKGFCKKSFMHTDFFCENISQDSKPSSWFHIPFLETFSFVTLYHRFGRKWKLKVKDCILDPK